MSLPLFRIDEYFITMSPAADDVRIVGRRLVWAGMKLLLLKLFLLVRLLLIRNNLMARLGMDTFLLLRFHLLTIEISNDYFEME